MNTNKKIQTVAFFTTIISLIAVILKRDSNETLCYDISLALFGSAAIAYCTAKITYSSEVKTTKRKIISNIWQIQKNFKKILFEYNKVINNFNAKDFENAYLEIRRLIDEFMSYSDTIKLESGKSLNEFFSLSEITSVYESFVQMNGELHMIGTLIASGNNQLVIDTYNQCMQDDKETVEIIKKILRKEYGKNFESLNSIGLC